MTTQKTKMTSSFNNLNKNNMKSKQSPLQRINRIMKFYESRGVNKEKVNNVYRNVLKSKLKN